MTFSICSHFEKHIQLLLETFPSNHGSTSAHILPLPSRTISLSRPAWPGTCDGGDSTVYSIFLYLSFNSLISILYILDHSKMPGLVLQRIRFRPSERHCSRLHRLHEEVEYSRWTIWRWWYRYLLRVSTFYWSAWESIEFLATKRLLRRVWAIWSTLLVSMQRASRSCISTWERYVIN